MVRNCEVRTSSIILRGISLVAMVGLTAAAAVAPVAAHPLRPAREPDPALLRALADLSRQMAEIVGSSAGIAGSRLIPEQVPASGKASLAAEPTGEPL